MNGSVLTLTMNPAIDKTVTVDQLTFGELNRIRTVRTDAGGKGINVAKVLKRFAVPVTAWGIRAGREGQTLADKLDEYGIPSFFLESDGQTRTNLKVVDASTKRTTELNEPGFTPSPAVLERFESALEHMLKNVPIVVLGGSLPPGVPADYYRRLIGTANRHGVRVILDADGEALARGIEAKPFAVKPNIHELEALLGERLSTDADIVRAAGSLLDRGVELVLVSMGGDGSIAVDRRRAIRATPFPITPQSTVGAGDSMVAAMAYSFMNGLSLEETARWTSAAGTITASKSGTDVCTLDEVKRCLGLVRLSDIPLPV
ncbi:1-phosphofructokinase [Paenibacillus flagellatus]|uniref:Tagatose-6-phosphate kinase n=1 Tax=Paenibacillus flagellatus TaxID=2211139 RepID=A0A2V5KC20_9BACL|nr:1-phosphofructokinase [Paenibacillus flagellatus]PYI57131.1 1-phosphofructokinase [Paenibacillus flagellatus]